MTLLKLPPGGYFAISQIPGLVYAALILLTPMTWSAGLPLLYFALAWAGAFAILGWRRMDEAAKEAQKFALFWGAVAGTGMVFISLIAFPSFVGWAGDRIEAILIANPQSPMRPSTYGFSIGVAYLCTAQVIGFLVCWTGWWLAKR